MEAVIKAAYLVPVPAGVSSATNSLKNSIAVLYCDGYIHFDVNSRYDRKTNEYLSVTVDDGGVLLQRP